MGRKPAQRALASVFLLLAAGAHSVLLGLGGVGEERAGQGAGTAILQLPPVGSELLPPACGP